MWVFKPNTQTEHNEHKLNTLITHINNPILIFFLCILSKYIANNRLPGEINLRNF
jgi:hypothetical protein